MSFGEAAVGDGFVERLQTGQRIRLRLGRLAQIIKQPRMSRCKRLRHFRPQLLGEVFANQWVRIDGALVALLNQVDVGQS